MSFWNGKKVLITGHTGFKGSWLSIMLCMLGADVIGYALKPRTPNDNFEVCKLGEKITDIRGDIRDKDALERVFADFKPKILFHLAAQPLVLASYADITETYETNVMGTLNVLECIRGCNETKSAVIITSDKCYENLGQLQGYAETDRLGGYDPYSSSKACAEILVSSYRNSFLNVDTHESHGKAIATARAGNVIGGGDWSPDRIIPDCVRACISGKSIEIRSPKAIRPWQHVIEPLYGYIVLAEKLHANAKEYSGAWNFGPDMSGIISVWELAQVFTNKLGCGNPVDAYSTAAPHEAACLTLDITKAVNRLGWKPVIPIEQAVEMTAAWYKQFVTSNDLAERRSKLYKLCTEQIEYYFSKVNEQCKPE